jgi:bacteriocin biosynthesis cyclodehydratase domain-containing protein
MNDKSLTYFLKPYFHFFAKEGLIRAVSSMSVNIEIDDPKGSVADVLGFLSCPRTFADIVDHLKAKGLGMGEIRKTIDNLIDLRIIGISGGEKWASGFPDFLNRQFWYLDAINPGHVPTSIFQERMSGSTVGIVGLGALGGACLMLLARAGFVNLICYDDKDFDISDFENGIFPSSPETAVNRLDFWYDGKKNLSPTVNFISQPLPAGIDEEAISDKLTSIRPSLCIICCSDNPGLSRGFIKSCFQKKIPYLLVSQSGTIGRIGPLCIPNRSPCQDCDQNALPLEDRSEGNARHYLNEGICAMTASQAVYEVMRWTGKFDRSVTLSHILTFDASRCEWQSHEIFRNKRCPTCGITGGSLEPENAGQDSIIGMEVPANFRPTARILSSEPGEIEIRNRLRSGETVNDIVASRGKVAGNKIRRLQQTVNNMIEAGEITSIDGIRLPGRDWKKFLEGFKIVSRDGKDCLVNADRSGVLYLNADSREAVELLMKGSDESDIENHFKNKYCAARINMSPLFEKLKTLRPHIKERAEHKDANAILEKAGWIHKPFFLIPVLTVTAACFAVSFFSGKALISLSCLTLTSDPVFNTAALLIAFIGVNIAHEFGHWIFARSFGLNAFFRISGRFMLPGMETSVPAIVSIPGRQRCLIYASGMLTDIFLASVASALSSLSAQISGPVSFLVKVLHLFAFLQISSVFAQVLIFIRTDLYFILAAILKREDIHKSANQLLSSLFHGKIRNARRDPLTILYAVGRVFVYGLGIFSVIGVLGLGLIYFNIVRMPPALNSLNPTFIRTEFYTVVCLAVAGIIYNVYPVASGILRRKKT